MLLVESGLPGSYATQSTLAAQVDCGSPSSLSTDASSRPPSHATPPSDAHTEQQSVAACDGGEGEGGGAGEDEGGGAGEGEGGGAGEGEGGGAGEGEGGGAGEGEDDATTDGGGAGEGEGGGAGEGEGGGAGEGEGEGDDDAGKMQHRHQYMQLRMLYENNVTDGRVPYA